jgi:multidrug efflux pump
MASQQFAFPPIVDVRIDQANRDRHRSQQGGVDGLTMEQLGADLSSMLSGNFVNRFNIDGRSYKVIPQIERSGRLTARQLADIHVSGPGGNADPAVGDRHACTPASEPRSLNRFQQLNAIKISGCRRDRCRAARVLERPAAKILPPGSTAWTTRANRGSCARRRASSCPRWAWRCW